MSLYALFLAAACIVLTKTASTDAQPHRKLFSVTNGEQIRGQYIVELVDETDIATVTDQLLPFTLEIIETFHDVFTGFSAKNVTQGIVSQLLEIEEVLVVSEDGVVHADGVQNNAPWNLDFLDSSRTDGQYSYPFTGKGVSIYILDTGIFDSHSEFEGRVESCFDRTGEGCGDRNGHGTHVAGIAGSKTYGVAKEVTLHDFKVLDRDGSGSYSDVISSINQITSIKNNRGAGEKMIANLSLSGGFNRALNDAIRTAVRAGVVVIGAAGNNEGQDACSFSPGSSEAIVVGSVDEDGRISDFSNRGSCVDSWAPGRDITSLSNRIGRTTTFLGTSMAVPHAAGAAALYLQAGLSPSRLANGNFLSIVELEGIQATPRPTRAPSPLPTRRPTAAPTETPVSTKESCTSAGGECSLSDDKCCGTSTCRTSWSWTKGRHDSCRAPSIWS